MPPELRNFDFDGLELTERNLIPQSDRIFIWNIFNGVFNTLRATSDNRKIIWANDGIIQLQWVTQTMELLILTQSHL